MRIACPHCGPRTSAEFAYLGAADLTRPSVLPQPGDPVETPAFAAWTDYVYLRDNPPGRHRELWQHIGGCRAWVVVTRDVTTHEIFATEPARAGA